MARTLPYWKRRDVETVRWRNNGMEVIDIFA